MNRSREALGRNRRSPTSRSTLGPFIAGLTLLAAAGGYAYYYFTQPQRVFGSRELECAATEISWEQTGAGAFIIRGCDREIFAMCSEDYCHDGSLDTIETDLEF